MYDVNALRKYRNIHTTIVRREEVNDCWTRTSVARGRRSNAADGGHEHAHHVQRSVPIALLVRHRCTRYTRYTGRQWQGTYYSMPSAGDITYTYIRTNTTGHPTIVFWQTTI